MNIHDFLILAQAAAPAGAPPQSGFMMLPYLIFFMVIMYFMMIRPQQKKQKEHEALVKAVKTGDQVVTSSGIHGTISNVKDKTVIVKIADNVKVEFDRAAIVAVEKPASAT